MIHCLHLPSTSGTVEAYARFGKLKLLRPSDKVVELVVNGKICDILMKVGEAGEAFFVVGTDVIDTLM